MDYFSKRQPIALPTTTTVEPYPSDEKDPLVGSELAAEPLATHPPAPRSPKSKFRKVLKIVAHLFILSLFLRILSHHLPKHWCHRHRHHKGPPDHYAFDEIEMFSDRHEDLQCLSPAEWSDHEETPPGHHGEPRFSSNASFILPASSESLLFYAHGSYAHGGIQFVEDDTGSLSSDDIAVDINVRFWTEEALEQANVCTLRREVGHGIGIFTPTERHRGRRHDELRFHISVRFPKSSEIKDLKTFLPLFTHYFPKTDVRFKALSVHSANFPIFAESLLVESGKVRTSNSAIKGNFTVTNSLEITTSNAPIVVNVTMNNAEKENPTKLFVQTSNAPLKSNLALISTSSRGTGGQFIVETLTSNSPLVVKFPYAAIDSVLHLSAKTSNSPAFVELNPAYEGTFSLTTSIFRPRVDVNENVEDPTGEGRQREVDFNTVGKELKGSVHWGDDTENQGHVELVTSILPAHLRL
jgi:hypothetical protein